ncbi:MAG: hypothetical protein IKZ09_03100 [Clostridia bacterium]|nr:hypothetical protein [Clostridia bacterium]
MADVLMRGWWWIPGTKNDALFARIKEAAVRGHNEEVMAFIVSTEDQKMWGASRIDYMKTVQIPMLEKNGYTKALAQEWFWLGEVYSDEGDAANAIDAFDQTLHLTGVDDIYHANAQAAKQMEQKYLDSYTEKPEKNYRMRAGAQKLFIESGLARRYNDYWYGKGLLCSADVEADFIFTHASLCDGYFTAPDTSLGQSFVGSDGTTLTYLRDNETVTVPAGTFAGCQVWQTRRSDATYLTYFANGVGIVRQERMFDGITEVRNLSSYSVRGDGLLPLVTGNTWEYTTEHASGTLAHSCRYTVAFADEESAVIGYTWELERLSYDENSWIDMILRIRNDYWDGDRVQDVTPYMERAKALARTPAEIAHTAAACSVAQRIMDTDCNLHPDTTVTGHWNFFARNTAKRTEDGQRITLDGNFLWSFELKNINTAASQQLIYNDVLGILSDDCNCIWDDGWTAGTTHEITYLYYGRPIKTTLVCEDAGTVSTAAGTFENCLRMCIDTHGFDSGVEYRGGKKIYTFAPGIGIIRAENCNAIGSRSVVYELTAYEGVGEGYQPLVGGLMRRYALLDPTDGYIGAVEYTYAEDNGAIAIFENRTGIRRKPDAVTEYAYIEREQEEERLWDAGKHEESRALHAQNNIHLFAHFLGRPSRYWAAPEKAVAWNKYRLQLLENTGIDGNVPRAWLGFYAATCFRHACALFGMGQKEEGYDYLERSFAPMERWLSFGADEKLEFGDPLIWGDIGIVRGGEELILSDGTREPLSYEITYLFDENRQLFYYGMTAKHGWEWFDGVRGEDRFKAYLPRAQAMTETK